MKPLTVLGLPSLWICCTEQHNAIEYLRRMDLRLCALMFLLIGLSANAQSPYHFQHRNGKQLLLEGTIDPTFPDEYVNDRVYRNVQFYQTPNDSVRERFEAQGWRFLNYLGSHCYLVSLPFTWENSDQDGVRAIFRPTANSKLHPKMLNGPFPEHAAQGNRWLVNILLQKDIPHPLAAKLLEDHEIMQTRFRGATVLLKANQFLSLAEQSWVHWLEFIAPPGQPEDTPGRSLHRSNGMLTSYPLGRQYDGQGVNMVINDDGFVGPHIDFKGRLNQQDVAGDLSGDHGDMTAGIAGGAANLDPSILGMAPASYLHIRQYHGDMPGTVGLHADSAVMVFSTSYSNGCNAGYTSTTELLDQEVFDHNSILQVFSAGNNNNADCGYGAGFNWGNITGGHKIAKNVIATANLTNDDVLVNSSSRGPASDGRIKPDISANGNGQLSTDPYNTYNPGGGTSAAAPGIAGVSAQLYQAYRELNGGIDPSSALIKACLLNTADDLGNPGPDFKFGWGRVHGLNALRTLEQQHYLISSADQGQIVPLPLEVPTGTAQLKVMLYWLDPPASTQAPLALVNDLDMELMDLNSMVHLPFLLDTTPDPALLNLPAIPGKDHINNMEQVVLMDPTPGTYSINVEGFNVPFGPQEFIVVYQFIKDEVELVYPLGGEGFIPAHEEFVRWDALNTNDNFLLEFSGDNGNSWSNLTSVNGSQRFIQWYVPDSLTGQALLRISQNGSSDQSDTTFTIMRPPTGIEVVWQCSDSLLLAWDRHPDAAAYIPYFLGQKFMEALPQTTDTFAVFYGHAPVEEDWFSVQAVAQDGGRSRRAVAVQAPYGLLNCAIAEDMTTLAVLSPPISAANCQNDNNVVVSALMQNIGVDTIFNWQGQFQVNGGIVNSANFSGALAPGDSVIVEFPPTDLGLEQDAVNSLEVWCVLPSDDFIYNDTVYSSVELFGTSASFPWSNNLESMFNCTYNSACLGQVCALTEGLTNAEHFAVDDMDWRVDSAGTPTPGTGPEYDHTIGGPTGHYLYTESTGGCTMQEAHLLLPCIALPDDAALTFWYNMRGADIGELHVDVMKDMVWHLDVMPPIIGEQGPDWQQAYAWLGDFGGHNVSIRIRGITGSSNLSDLAIDDLGVDLAIGVDEHATGFRTVHPNPSNGLYYIELTMPGKHWIEVFDSSGKLVLRTQVAGRSQLDLRTFPSGVYSAFLRHGEAPQPLRLLKF